MSKESYARGFCKAAEAAGIDPVALAKYASANTAVTTKTPRPPKGLDSLKSVNPSFSDWVNLMNTMPRYARDGVRGSKKSTEYGRAIEDGTYEIAPDIVKRLPDWAIDDALAKLDRTRSAISGRNAPVQAQDQVSSASQISANDLARLIYASHTNYLNKAKAPEFRLFGQK